MTVKKESTSNDKGRPREAANPSPATHTVTDRLPPSYDSLYPPPANAAPATSRRRRPATVSTQDTENVNTMRSRNPRLALDPPLPQHTLFATAEAAASTAVLGIAQVFVQTERSLVAAHTARAIAIAVSTSRSYTAFVAATTAAESAAMIVAECDRYNTPDARKTQRARNAIRHAAEAAVAATAGNTATGSWPSDIHEADAMHASHTHPPSGAPGRS
ncbi:hypothetical protein diail_1980 [Diaporthe ilicicola]|nr:hypothetical protein diail_1980 [Diaporthe ilicicola]